MLRGWGDIEPPRPAALQAAASILPGAALVLLPKCPLCLAAWLTAATGIGFSAAGATWARGMLMLFAVAAVVLAITPIVRCMLAPYPTVVGCFLCRAATHHRSLRSR